MYLYQVTDFPELFKKTYWGGTQYDPSESQIIVNRNKFALTYELTSLWLRLKVYPNVPILDHQEIYKTESEKVILIYSPYSHYNPKKDRFNVEFKFEQIDKLYDPFADTYLKVFDELDELRHWASCFEYFNRYGRGDL